MEKKNTAKKVLKIFLIILLITLVLLLIHTIRNFVIIKGLQNNFSKYENSTNYQIKAVMKDSNTPTINTMNYYTKDGKELGIVENKNNGEIHKVSMYNNGERIDIFYDNPNEKACLLNTDTLVVKVNLYDHLATNNTWQTILGSVTARIKSTNYNGKDCYIVNNFMSPSTLTGSTKNEVYIEKDTGLFIKSIQDSIATEREYTFNNVEDSIFTEPDIGKYKIKENK